MGYSIWSVTRRRIWERDQGVCQLCQQPVPFDRFMHLDHVEAAAHGGESTDQNLRTTHRLCNQRRGTGRQRNYPLRLVDPVTLLVPLPTDLHKELSDVAKQEQRSVNAQIIYVLQQWLERQRRPAQQRAEGEE